MLHQKEHLIKAVFNVVLGLILCILKIVGWAKFISIIQKVKCQLANSESFHRLTLESIQAFIQDYTDDFGDLDTTMYYSKMGGIQE